MIQILTKKTIRCLLLLVLTAGGFACKNTFDLQPQQALDRSQHYRNIYDADAAVIGIYGKLMGLAKQYLVLNELRADLVDATLNADPYLLEINTHNVTAGNPYADPRPFYEVILNCNDVLYNFDIMLRNKKLEAGEYAQRYADIGAIRCWLYLQLGIHFGAVPYVVAPLENVADLQQLSTLQKLPFEQLLDELIKYMEALPFKEPYTSSNSLLTTVDGYSTNIFFINKKCLLGDLYLWKGNYLQAAVHYKAVMETGAQGEFDKYRVPWADVSTNNDNNVGYIRYREHDMSALIDNNTQGWRALFARQQDKLFNNEWIWVLPFDKSFSPRNPFIDLFANTGGQYQLMPSQAAIDNWNAQTQWNGFPFDARGRFSWRTLQGQPVIMKYLYNYLDPVAFTPLNLLDKNGKWFLYRAATLHLRYAEAANRNGRHKLAFALLNQGIKTTFDTDPANTDQTSKQATFDAAPYDFNARMGDYPYFRDPWHRNNGIRGRAYLYPMNIVQDSMPAIEEGLINEAGLELAFEGQRWPDLLRVALRRNDPAFLANKVYEKLQKAGHPAAATVRGKLMNRANWYLPFK